MAPRPDGPDALSSSFLVVVLGTYKQMRNQNVAIMSDIDEDNFDRAFDILRPGRVFSIRIMVTGFTFAPLLSYHWISGRQQDADTE